MATKVTDPALLAQLNGGGSSPKKVTDPAILAQLNGQDAPAPQSGGFDLGQTLRSVGDAANSFQSAAMQGMTFGLDDEINAGLGALPSAAIDAVQGKGFDVGKAYNEGLDRYRGMNKEAQDKNPVAAQVGDVTGSLVTGGELAKGGVTLLNAAKPTIMSLATRGAAEGAAYGAANGFGRADGDLGDRVHEAVNGSLWGAATGGAFGATTGALMRRAGIRAVPSVDDLKAHAGSLYDAAEARGVTFPQPAVKQLADEVAAKALTEGIDPTLHPRATAALKRLQDAGQTGMTVKDAQTLRRVLSSAGKDPMNPDEGRIAGQMVQKLDEFVGNAAPELAQARTVYSQAKRGERIEQAIELAGSRAGQFSGSGFENALRTEFRSLERQIIKGQIKGLSQEEIDSISKVARGGPIENILRFVGKFAPSGNVSTIGGALAGNAFGGPVGAAAVLGTGAAGRALATRATINNARVASALARSGGHLPAPRTVNPRVLQALIAGGASEAARIPHMLDIAVHGGRTVNAR